MSSKIYFSYIITNQHHTTLYTGITNNLVRRAWEHRSGIGSQFSKRYNLYKLVYYESFGDVKSAIFREKQIKSGSRRKKIELIESLNPGWQDLFDEF